MIAASLGEMLKGTDALLCQTTGYLLMGWTPIPQLICYRTQSRRAKAGQEDDGHSSSAWL